MKKFLVMSLVLSSIYATSAHASILRGGSGNLNCYDMFGCALTLTSFPTLLVATDIAEMSQADAKDFLQAEAQNYLDGIDGDYLVLKATAQKMNKSVEAVAQDLLK